MNDYVHNKSPKDKKLCQLIRKTITINRKELGLEFEDVAFELGLNAGTLSNKLKPSMMHSDLTLTEFIHFLELTGSYEALQHIANEFGLTLVKNCDSKPIVSDINTLVDNLAVENSELFIVAKNALNDNSISSDEKLQMMSELEDVIIAASELKSQLEGV